MKIEWVFEAQDIIRINKFVNSLRNHPFVKRRIERNTDKKNPPDFNKSIVWNVIVTCLLSTQQRSGPGSPLYKFCSKRPFPLNLEKCVSNASKLGSFVEKTIKNSGGIRRFRTISEQVERNFKWINEGWEDLHDIANELLEVRKIGPRSEHIKTERMSAQFIQDNFSGFGPKQSRGFWQTLGLFQFEIPIDSRIIKWLNRSGFPVKLSANALSDINYYNFIMSGIQIICAKCDILPCVFDAAVFASFDKDWPEDVVVW